MSLARFIECSREGSINLFIDYLFKRESFISKNTSSILNNIVSIHSEIEEKIKRWLALIRIDHMKLLTTQVFIFAVVYQMIKISIWDNRKKN